jgi:hypothetical protein
MIQIPKNRIVENQYTNGTGIGKNLTLRFVKSKIPYVGFYNIVNGSKYFTGKTYDGESKPLEKYSLIQAASKAIAAAGSVPVLANSLTGQKANNIRYFYKDLTNTNIAIKEIDQKTYNKLSVGGSVTYQVISFNSNVQSLDEVNKQMPGLREFLVT